MQSNLAKRLFSRLLQLYMLPIRTNEKLKRYAREMILIEEEDHIKKPVWFLSRNGFLNENPVVLDIGCSFGTATEAFLRLVPGCTVIAFEPNPQIIKALIEKFAGKPVVFHNIALSNKIGTILFHQTDNSVSSSYKTIAANKQFAVQSSYDVKIDMLDNILAKNASIQAIDILKLDVQGAEMDVLNGAQLTLEKTKLIVVQQSIRSPYKESAAYYEIDEFLRNCGFEILDIIVTYRKKGMVLNEFDSIYINKNLKANLI